MFMYSFVFIHVYLLGVPDSQATTWYPEQPDQVPESQLSDMPLYDFAQGMRTANNVR